MQLVPKRSSLVAQTAVIFRDGIKAGLWKDCLPGKLGLGRRLQASRLTLRAALERLQREGWCRSGQGHHLSRLHLRQRFFRALTETPPS